VFGVLEFGFGFWAYSSMMLAVEEAGRFAMLYKPTNFPSGPPASSCTLPSPTLATCAAAWANSKNWGADFGSVSCTDPIVATPPTMTCSVDYTIRFLNISFTLHQGVRVPVGT
jgi:hypothetical protein